MRANRIKGPLREQFLKDLFTLHPKEVAKKYGYAVGSINVARSKLKGEREKPAPIEVKPVSAPVPVPKPAPPPVEPPKPPKVLPPILVSRKPLDVPKNIPTDRAAEILGCKEHDVESVARVFKFAPIAHNQWSLNHIEYIKLLQEVARDPSRIPALLSAQKELFFK